MLTEMHLLTQPPLVRTLTYLAFGVFAACSDGTAEETETQTSPHENACSAKNSDVEPVDAYGDVAETNTAGLWVFSYEEQSGDEALLTGTAGEHCGCLAVDGFVVVWDRAQFEQTQDLATKVQNGEAPQVSLVGGETQNVPAEVLERCNVESVFYQNSDS